MKKIYTAALLPAKVKIFIDIGAFIALGWEKDLYHKIAINFYRSNRNKWRMFTSNYIITETYTWLRYHTSSLHALSFLETIKKLQSKDRLTLIYTSRDMEDKIKQLLRRYRDVVLSYPDAATGVIVNEFNIPQIFGFDSHLAMFGKTGLPGIGG
ncbi:MAG: type II toxin-antitoxin system VapC family toxin [Moorella humiferrea]|nr:type II toxin-antitoxin system VapC family toxin [Moorella humiferrea]